MDNAVQGEVRTIEGGVPPGHLAMFFKKLGTAMWWPQVWNTGYELAPGGVYEFSIMAKGDLAQVNLRATSMVDGTSVKVSESRDVTPEFTRLYLQFEVTEGAQSVSIGLSAPRGPTGEVVYDNAILRRLVRAPGASHREYYAIDW